jgi:hypothetical protein
MWHLIVSDVTLYFPGARVLPMLAGSWLAIEWTMAFVH